MAAASGQDCSYRTRKRGLKTGISTIFQLGYDYYPYSAPNTPQQNVPIDSARVVRLNMQYYQHRRRPEPC